MKQTDYTPKQLRALDEWAAGFVGLDEDGQKPGWFDFNQPKGEWAPSKGYSFGNNQWHHIYVKCNHMSFNPKFPKDFSDKVFKRLGIKHPQREPWGDRLFEAARQNPAAVLEAIREVVEEKK